MNHRKLIFLIITLHHYKNIEKHGMRNKNLPLIINQYIILFILLKLDVEMKILNEDLEKYIVNDEKSHDLIFIFIYSIVICLTGFLTVGMMGEYDDVNKKFIFYMNDFFTILLVLAYAITMTIVTHITFRKYHKYQSQKNKSRFPNSIIEKLKNIYKNNKSLNSDDLIDIWNEYNTISNKLHPSQNNADSNADVIVLHKNEEQSNSENMKLFQKLDDDLVYFIENADDITIKLFNLGKFDSYQQLYMKYIAPKEKGYLLRKIKRLLASLSNTNNSQENYIIQQLNELKNEIEKYNIDTKDYFEFKKWNDDTWKMLKLDKNNDMVTKQYQEIMQKING